MIEALEPGVADERDNEALFTGPISDPRRFRAESVDVAAAMTGGQGVVVRAFDQLAQRFVALKMLTRVPFSEFSVVAERSATLSSIRHPNLMGYFDAFAGTALARGRSPLADEFDVAYVVAEWIDGQLLNEIDIAADPRSALRHLVSLARAVGALHQHRAPGCAFGVVHCDVKPSNVCVTAHGKAVLIDFDTARTVNPGGLAIDVGTYRWQAPESVAGPLPPTGALDVWGVGAVGHWILTGEPPALDGAGVAFERMAHTERTRSIPNGRAVASLVASLLATEPSERATDLDRWANRLEALVCSSARRSWYLGRPRRHGTRRMLPATVVGGVGACAVIAVAGALTIAGGGLIDRRDAGGGSVEPVLSRVTASVPLRLTAVYNFSNGDALLVLARSGLSIRDGDRLALEIERSMRWHWTYGGVSAEAARANCRDASARRRLTTEELVYVPSGPVEIGIMLGSAGGSDVLSLGDERLLGPPVDVRADAAACGTALIEAMPDPTYPFGVTVPVDLWFAAMSLDVAIPFGLTAGGWIVHISRGAETAVAAEPLVLHRRA